MLPLTLMRLRRLSPTLLLTAWLGCVPAPPYYCQDNRACVSSDGTQGLCEPTGTCSFPDTSCAGSQRRYGAGASATACVPAGNQCIAGLSLGPSHACALRADGAVLCWGSNSHGQAGAPLGVARLVTPTPFALPSKATAVSVGEAHSCAVLVDGRVMCWGSNDSDDLGNDNSGVASVVPVEVRGPAGASFRARAIAAGDAHTCAIAADGGVVSCWGQNWVGEPIGGGQCGQDPRPSDGGLVATVPHAMPIAAAGGVLDSTTGLAVGHHFTCGIGGNSNVYCFGSNHSGYLGSGGLETSSYTPVVVADLADVAQLAVGAEHACARRRDGSTWCWGYGGSGSLGLGTTSNAPVPTRVGRAARVITGSASYVTCSIDDASLNVQCWGANDTGQTATGSTDPVVFSPTKALFTSVDQLALGNSFGCATTLGGGLWCWGKNDEGQLGQGSVGDSVLTPRRVDFPCP